MTAAGGGSGSDVTVSGVAQPGATGVAVTATDAAGAATTPVDATLNADGTWNASIPSADLTDLADGAVTLDATYAVPDVATGAAAHIDGAPLAIEKKSVDGGVEVTPAPDWRCRRATRCAGYPAHPRTPVVRPQHVEDLPALARKGRIRVALYVPSGAKVVRVRLSHGGKTKYLKYFTAASAGTRQVLYLKGKSLQSVKRGAHTLTVSAGPSRTQQGNAIKSRVTVN